MSDQDRPPEELDSVELIASGYEWVCPRCDQFHRIMETVEEVECQRCHWRYEVGDIHHATP